MPSCKTKNKKIARQLLVAISVAIISACGGGGGASNADATTEVTPIRAGAAVTKGMLGIAVVGKAYTTKIESLPNDSRNAITGITIVNLTVGGSAATVDAQGNVTWIPNATDLESTTSLKVTLTLREGAAVIQTLPVKINREVVVLDAALGADEASYSDDDGQYIVRAVRTDANIAIQGRIKITEYYDKNQLRNFYVRGQNNNSTVQFKIIKSKNIAELELSTLSAPSRAYKKPTTINKSIPTTTNHPLTVLDLTQDAFKNADLQISGSVIESIENGDDGYGITNIYSSRGPATYNLTVDGNAYAFNSSTHEIYNYASNCSTQAQCITKALTKAPIVLIHGFSGYDNIAVYGDVPVGGGDGTWGKFAKELTDKGHPVFEFQWHTYQRFEEAAGVFTKYTEAISKYTNKKPIVVAHSFGGIVAHLAMQSQGIRFSQGVWNPVLYKNQLAKAITLNSPLSGINYPSAGSTYVALKPTFNNANFKMTRGRDATDYNISACYSITCLQAGAVMGGSNKAELIIGAALIDGAQTVAITAKTLISGGLVYEGESIERLQRTLNQLATPVLKFAGYKGLNIKNNNVLLGDGLISLIGMAAIPGHFSDDPYNTSSLFKYNFIDSNTPRVIYSNNATPVSKTFNNLIVGDCFRFTGAIDNFSNVNSSLYIICAQSAHTDSNRVGFSTDFSIANLGSEDSSVAHPLYTLMDDTNWLAAPPEDAPFITDLLALAPTSFFNWKAYKTVNGVKEYSYLLPAFLKIIKKSTGEIILYEAVQGDFSTKFYRYNLGEQLTRKLLAVPNLNDYSLKLEMRSLFSWTLPTYGSYSQEFTNLAGVQTIVPEIDLTPSTLVSFTGSVIDGQTESTTVPDATIYFAKGADLTAAVLKNISNTATKTTRKITTDALGNFSISGIESGEYSVLVSKNGYTEELQGRVSIRANGVLSLSLLRVTIEDTITLRWANSNAGANVVSDLDSHLIRLNSDGTPNYHIFYGNQAVPGVTDNLDRDDTDYVGPETISFIKQSGKDYSYYVHQYSSNGTIVESLPRVFLRIGATTQTFTPPNVQGSSRYWRVFNIENGIVIPCQSGCMLDVAPTSLATRSGAGTLPPAVASMLSNLPPKTKGRP